MAGAAAGLVLAVALAGAAPWPPAGSVAAAPARPRVQVWQEPTPPPAADPYAPDRAEEGSAAAIAALTGSLRLLPPSVAYLPAAAGVPSPPAVLGHPAGAAEIGRTADVHRYFRRLAAVSDRVRVQAIGTSEEGREILLAAVSAGHNLSDLSYFRETAARLADPRRTGREEAERLAESGKLVYHVVGGLAPGEVASPEMLAELAFRLAVSERPEAQAVREQAIVLITPVAEPDAYDRAVEWYRRHLRQRAGQPWAELREVLAPPYGGRYGAERWAAAGDDGLGLASTRAMAAAFFGFHPQLVQELGTSAPLLALGSAGAQDEPPPGGAVGAGALADGADPWPELAASVRAALREAGLPGVRDEPPAGSDPGHAATTAAHQPADAASQPPDFPAAPMAGLALATDHNAAAGVVGVFANGAPGDYEREVGELEAREPAVRPEAAPGARERRPRRPVRVRAMAEGWPPAGRVRWSLRDTVNYQESATLAALAWAAGHRRELLAGSWRRGARALARARAGPPFAWLLPKRQADPARLTELVRRLLEQRIEVHRLSEDLALAGGRRFPAGSWLVRLDQPYSEAARRFLAGDAGAAGGERAEIPWPLLYGVDAVAIDDPAVLTAPMTAVTRAAAAPPPGGIEGDEPPPPPAAAAAGPGSAEGPGGAAPAADVRAGGRYGEVFLLRDTGQVSLLAARIALGPYQVDAAEAPFTAAGIEYPLGSWLVQAPRVRVARVAERLGLTFAAAAALPEVPRHVVHLPRLGLLHGWTDAEVSAWVRRALDAEHLPYSLLGDGDLRRGGLGQRFDVLVLAGADPDWRRRLRGIDGRWSPLAFTRTGDFPSHGVPDGAADVTGGLDEPGLQELRRFVAGGGVLVTLGAATTLVAATGLAPGLSLSPPRPGEAGGAAGAAGGDPAAGDQAVTGVDVAAQTAESGAGVTGLAADEAGAATAPAEGPAATAAKANDAKDGTPASAVAAELPEAAGVPVSPAELRVRVVRRDHPVTYGYPELTQVLRRGGPLLWASGPARAGTVLRFGSGAGTVARPPTPSAGGASLEGGASPPPDSDAAPRPAGESAPPPEGDAAPRPEGEPAAPPPDAAAAPAMGGTPARPAAGGALEVEDIDAAKGAAPVPRPPAATASAADPAWAPPLPRPLGDGDGRLVLAGRLPEGEAAVEGRPAIVDLPLGEGHLVAFAFNPFDPSLGAADLRLVYNVLLNWHALPR
jgi:Zinc carboxypeptidase